jgi:hypothetical protein
VQSLITQLLPLLLLLLPLLLLCAATTPAACHQNAITYLPIYLFTKVGLLAHPQGSKQGSWGANQTDHST